MQGAPAVARSLFSPDGQHGQGVARAQWTTDSRFLVVQLESSGGHQPLQRPILVFDRAGRRIGSAPLPADLLPEAYRLSSGDTLRVSALDVGRQSSVTRVLHLAAWARAGRTRGRVGRPAEPPPESYEAGEPQGRMPAPGACVTTRVRRVTTRLTGVARSGTTLLYMDGHAQVSYGQIAAADASRAGDRVRLCAVQVPTGCPPGDFRGVVYRATNSRTGLTWRAPNAEHQCWGG